jgi:enoyl-CoA hydratase/carnithine racemase
MGFDQALALERELGAQLWSSADAREGVKAYLEKRKARFEGE